MAIFPTENMSKHWATVICNKLKEAGKLEGITYDDCVKYATKAFSKRIEKIDDKWASALLSFILTGKE